MAEMNLVVQEMVRKVPIAVLATAGLDGIPNAVPVAIKRVLDADTILISDQFFNKTLTHIMENSQVSLLVWEGNEGYQIKGTATYESEGPRFDKVAQMVEEYAASIGAPLKSKGACFIQVEAVYSVAPGPHAGEQLT